MKHVIAIALVTFAGCIHTPPPPAPPPTLPTATFSQYHLDSFPWHSVARVLVLPFVNESDYTRAGGEVSRAFQTELQSLGMFEVVSGPADAQARIAATQHRVGKFNEALMMEIAAATRADIIIHATVTEYSPYPRPRLGLIVQAVSPADGKVVASVDGMWDSTRYDVASRIRKYYRMNPHQHPWVANHDITEDDSYSGEMALDSPQLFQRFVCAEAVVNLVKDTTELPQAPPSGWIQRPDLSRNRRSLPGW